MWPKKKEKPIKNNNKVQLDLREVKKTRSHSKWYRKVNNRVTVDFRIKTCIFKYTLRLHNYKKLCSWGKKILHIYEHATRSEKVMENET